MSFIFEQIDQIEKQKEKNDDTLQRIRAWRQSKQQQNQETVTTQKVRNPEVISSVEESPERDSAEKQLLVRKEVKEVELVHPWPEWIELMERLVKQNYFDHRRKDEDKMVKDLGFEDGVEESDIRIDFSDFRTVQKACINFGKDRFDILRSLSRQDIQTLVGYGCPSADKKVVFSAKLLRKHAHLDEGDVCSTCSLRSSCQIAYLLTNKEDEARTIDVMRVLLTYGFDPVNGSVVNKSLLKQKSVKNVVRKLLHEVVKLSAVPIDPNLPPPVIKKPPPKVKQPPTPPKKRVGRDDVEMKKGDWLCPKCDFLNFAKNTVCLQCDAKRPKRQLLPGEWECPECNFLNYRRNMACFHCDCKRPPDEFIENKILEKRRDPEMRSEKIAHRPEVSNAWNFDFDDDESDGADVAAFEYADSPRRGEDSPLGSLAHEGNFRGHEDDFNRGGRFPRTNEREFADVDSNRPRMGFDDFDDDEDDIDSYEIDTQNNHSLRKASPNDFSEVEDRGSDNFYARRRESSPSYNGWSKPMRRKAGFSGSENDELGFDTDDQLSVHPNWKSSHVADSRHISRGRGPTGSSKGLSFGSDEEFDLNSDADDDLEENFRSSQKKGNKPVSGRRFQSKISSDTEDDSFSGSESDTDDRWRRNRPGGNKIESGRRGKTFEGHGGYKFVGDTEFRSNGKMGDRRKSSEDGFNRSSQGSRSNNRGPRHDSNGKWGMNDRGRDSRNFRGPKREGFPKREGYGNPQHGRSYKFDKDDGEFRRGRDSRNFRGPKREGYGNPQHGRSYKFDKDDGEFRRGRDSRNFRGPKREGYGNPQHGRSYKYDKDDGDAGEFRNSRRVIER
ncbi:hypothetical protein Patl1_22610 [Pistacia atlantica]|uniref:Uncharacterized protein n=1 Tax=Pistacia atlantica TaxID=434234 RepID=A0ACC0ZYY5_9ROSI|nr:hypothetical protein Patl1_22610 [Pistacia atlantica]